MPVCANCGTENPDIAKFCLACGSALAAAPPPQEFRKVVSIVFSDLKGSTAMGEKLDSESLREVMTRYFDSMRTELERHGGVVEKFIGDAIMAVFGLPKLHEDDALRAVRAAAGMQRALADLNDELESHWGVRLTVRTGVNTGEVVSGDPTAGQRLVTGDAVNVAARLEQAAGAQEVLLGDLTYRLVREYVEVEEVEPLELKGKSERVPAYRLLGVHEVAERPRRLDSPMVGRDNELSVLQNALGDAIEERTCRLVTVVGEAGVGKSRLVDEFVRSAEDRASFIRGRCLSYGDGITFWPLAEAAREAAGIVEQDSAEDARAKLSALASDDVVARVASAIGLSPDQFPVDELVWGARKLLEALARRRPLLVLFEDVHWAETTFLELIESVVGASEDAALMIVCSTRQDLIERRPDWSTGARSSRLLLERLTEEQTAAVAAHLLGSVGLDDRIRRRIVDAAEGNPLFVEQLLSMLIDNGLIRFEDGSWWTSELIDEVAVPPTIQALLAARIDHLDPDERGVIEPASVVGSVFVLDAVRYLVEEPLRVRVGAKAASLVQKELVRPDLSRPLEDEAYRFHHILIRDTVYDGILKRARAGYHERFVQWGDSVNREGATEYEEILGYHLEQAYRYLSELGPLDEHGRALGTSAATRLASAGRRAFGRGDMRAASNLLRRAVGLLPERQSERSKLLPDLAESLVETGEFAAAETYLEEATTAATEVGDERLSAHATLVRLLAQLYAGDSESWSEQVLTHAPEIIRTLEGAEDHAGLAKAHRLVCIVHGTRCQFGDFLASAEREIRHARLAGERRQQARAATAYASAALYGPTPVVDALRRCEEVLRLADGDKRSEGITLCLLANLRAMSGEFDEARRLYSAGRALLEEIGAAVIAASTAMQSGAVEVLAGDSAAAERELRRGYDALTSIGETYFAPSVASELAHVLCTLRRSDEALELTVKAEQLAAPDDVWTQARWRSARAKALAQSVNEQAVALARAGVELMSRTDALVWQADALVDLAEVLSAQGLAEEALSGLEEAMALYEAKGDLVAAARARALGAAALETSTSASA